MEVSRKRTQSLAALEPVKPNDEKRAQFNSSIAGNHPSPTSPTRSQVKTIWESIPNNHAYLFIRANEHPVESESLKSLLQKVDHFNPSAVKSNQLGHYILLGGNNSDYDNAHACVRELREKGVRNYKFDLKVQWKN